MHLVNESKYNKYARWESTTVKILGIVEIFFGLALLIPLITAIIVDESIAPFITIIPVLMILGLVQFTMFRESKNFRAVNGLLLVAAAWIIAFGLGSYPYIMSGMSLIDAVFESVSGLTTTGATIMADIESWPMSILIWRSLSQWIGGISIIIIFMYFLPMFGMGRSFFLNELAGSGSSDYSMKMKNAAKSFIIVYALLSLANLVLLLICGMGAFEAVCLTFSTISTGGLMCTNDSLAGYSDLIQIITIVFMFMGGTNFYLHYRALYRKSRKVYRSNSEFKNMTQWFIGISILIYLMILFNMYRSVDLALMDHLEIFKNALFTTVSLGTSTGFSVDDYTLYPAQCVILLMIVAFIGASAGSTSGGVKFGRLRIIYGFVKNSINKTIMPNAVFNVKVDGSTVDNSAVLSAVSIFLMYIITMFIGAIVIMMYGMDLVDSFGLSILSVANGGLGFGNYGPSGTLSELSAPIKLILIALMWIGRLEILLALTYFTPAFWREVWLNHRAKKREKAIVEKLGRYNPRRR